MRVSIDPNDVEELAWLVKDNLQTKHLILAAEELFVEFLGPQFEYHHVRHCAIPVLWRILRQAAAVMMVQRRSESGVGVYVVLSTHAFASTG